MHWTNMVSFLVGIAWVAAVVAQPAGQPVRVDISADTWVSEVGKEADGNNGGSGKLKTKGIQEITIVDIDAGKLAGRVIRRATLHLRSASADIQRRLTVSTLATPWVEGTGTNYQVLPGSASFNFAEQGRLPWAYPGSDLTAVCNGMGNTIWRFADATPPDKDGWQTVAVEPAVVAARVAGISHGFVVMDDVGSEYTRDGEKFTYHHMPNRYVYSRQSNRSSAPYFTVELGEEDRLSPGGVGELKAKPDTQTPGEAAVTWITPADKGPAGVIGFVVRCLVGDGFDWASAKPVPQYLVPRPAATGKPVTMQLHDLPMEAGARFTLGVAAVDGAGNVGPVTTSQVRLSARAAEADIAFAGVPEQLRGRPLTLPSPRSTGARERSAELIADKSTDRPVTAGQLGNIEVAIVESLDKVRPGNGKFIPATADGHGQWNQIFDLGQKTIRLNAARNEFVDFQVLLLGKAEGVTASVSFGPDTDASAERITASLHRYGCVDSAMGLLPDPLIPLNGPFSVPDDRADKDAKSTAVLSDIYVPHTASAGLHEGKLTLKRGEEAVVIRILLNVWNFTLPDRLSFIPEMNCYGLPDGPEQIKWYRLAHAHRTCLNRLGYNWRGQVNDGCGPKWDGRDYQWEQYDKLYGPLLDGSAFADMPRKSVPVEAFYLPINENWPIAINPAFKGGYWAEQALTEQYARDFAAACGKFAQHLAEKKWNDTLFEFYLNNKVYFKKDAWSRSSAPWIFDEPSCTQDFWALRYYGKLFHQGIAPFRGQTKMAYRGDISRPQWQRDILDGLLDVNVVGGDFRKYHRLVIERKGRERQLLINYGTANRIEDSNWHAVAWCLDSWRLGADGVLPWQTVGTEQSWKKADQLALFYPGKPVGIDGPVPSIRLKAYRRGQQLVEYLVMLEASGKYTHWQLSQALLKHLSLNGQVKKTSADDAGLVDYGSVTPDLIWSLRQRLGFELDALHPPAQRQWVDLRTPVRDVAALPEIGYVTGRQ